MLVDLTASKSVVLRLGVDTDIVPIASDVGSSLRWTVRVEAEACSETAVDVEISTFSPPPIQEAS